MTGRAPTHTQAKRIARRRASRRKALALLAGMLLIALVGVAVQAQRGTPDQGALTPAGLDQGTGFVVGAPTAPVTVEVYEDFLCPACRRFEEQNAAALATLVDQGKVRVVYRVISILDRASTTDYSTRASNAAACAGRDAFADLHRSLFAAQPAEGGAGLPDSRLAALARDAGADPGVAQCIERRDYSGWVARVTDLASRRGVSGTPTVLVNGSRLASWSTSELLAAVAAASR